MPENKSSDERSEVKDPKKEVKEIPKATKVLRYTALTIAIISLFFDIINPYKGTLKIYEWFLYQLERSLFDYTTDARSFMNFLFYAFNPYMIAVYIWGISELIRRKHLRKEEQKSPIKYTCPECRENLELDDSEWQAKEFICPECKKTIKIS